MIEREREAEFIGWLRSEIKTMGEFSLPEGPCRPRLSAMREAGGVDYREAEAQSVAFQVEFDDIEAARKWSRGVFANLAATLRRNSVLRPWPLFQSSNRLNVD